MSRSLTYLALLLVFTGLSGCASNTSKNAPAADADDPYAIHLTPHKVDDRIWYFKGASAVASAANKGFTSNAGFIVTGDGVLVFDALGTPVLGQAMIDAIHQVTDQPIRRVIISHYHADHFYGLQAFKAIGAEVWARTEGQIYLHSDLGHERLAQRRVTLAPWVNEDTRLVPADRWITMKEDQTIAFQMGDRHFELISGGAAHAPDDMMLYVKEDDVLFAGDVFFSGRLPFVVGGNTREWLLDLDRIERFNPKIVIPGHGNVSFDVSHDLHLTRHYLQFVREKMGAAVDNLVSFDEAYANTDWSQFEKLPTFEAANRRNAYSVFLEMQSELLEE